MAISGNGADPEGVTSSLHVHAVGKDSESVRILIACEFSGIVRSAFEAKGHDAWSCDFLPTEIPGQHIQGDVRSVLGQQWDLIVSHPDCTYITNSGVRWLDRDIDRWKKMWDACQFFRLFLNHPCPRIAIENPVPHKYALQWIGTKYTHSIQPWQFGHPESKRTCLWLKCLPKLTPTDIVSGRVGRVHFESPGPDRWKNRSRTMTGIAKAMSEQWGSE